MIAAVLGIQQSARRPRAWRGRDILCAEASALGGAEWGRAMDPIATTAVTIAVVLIAFVVFVFVFRWIWNRTVPAVFGPKEITFWQAVGILVLASILTGGHRIVTTDVTSILSVRSARGPCR